MILIKNWTQRVKITKLLVMNDSKIMNIMVIFYEDREWVLVFDRLIHFFHRVH
jgi:hypothetical protein